MDKLPGGIRAVLDSQAAMPHRILWVTGTYFPDIGGAEWSAYSCISLLKRTHGQCILAATGHGPRVVDGVPVLEVESSEDIQRAIGSFRPRFVAAQGILASQAIRVGLAAGCVVVYFLRAKTALDFSKELGHEQFRIVANSCWMADWFRETWGIQPVVLRPPILPWLTVASHFNRRYIAHVGDAEVKGGERIARVAACLPDLTFLVTRSWPALRDGDAWSHERIAQLRAGDGAETAFEPRIADFSKLRNVMVRWPYLWPQTLYAQASILLVASKWREPYGRVVVEGLLNGLPVVVSPEVNSDQWAHLVYQVEDGDDPEAWIECIQRIRSQGLDPEKAEAIREFGRVYDLSEPSNALRGIFGA